MNSPELSLFNRVNYR